MGLTMHEAEVSYLSFEPDASKQVLRRGRVTRSVRPSSQQGRLKTLNAVRRSRKECRRAKDVALHRERFCKQLDWWPEVEAVNVTVETSLAVGCPPTLLDTLELELGDLDDTCSLSASSG